MVQQKLSMGLNQSTKDEGQNVPETLSDGEEGDRIWKNGAHVDSSDLSGTSSQTSPSYFGVNGAWNTRS